MSILKPSNIVSAMTEWGIDRLKASMPAEVQYLLEPQQEHFIRGNLFFGTVTFHQRLIKGDKKAKGLEAPHFAMEWDGAKDIYKEIRRRTRCNRNDETSWPFMISALDFNGSRYRDFIGVEGLNNIHIHFLLLIRNGNAEGAKGLFNSWERGQKPRRLLNIDGLLVKPFNFEEYILPQSMSYVLKAEGREGRLGADTIKLFPDDDLRATYRYHLGQSVVEDVQ